MTKLTLVTACERNYFLMTAVLMHTLKRCAPNLPLHVLDLGVDERQARFLDRHCKFIRRPADVPASAHPILAKTLLASYLRGTPWSSLVWIDCDMMAAGALERALDTLVARMESTGAQTAICRDDSRTLAGMVAGGLPMPRHGRGACHSARDALVQRRLLRLPLARDDCRVGGARPHDAAALVVRPEPVQPADRPARRSARAAGAGMEPAWDAVERNELARDRWPADLVGGGRAAANPAPDLVARQRRVGDVGIEARRPSDRRHAQVFKNPALRAVQDFILQDFGAEYLDELTRDGIAVRG